METFDERAATWDDDPAKAERARVIAEAINATLPLDGSERLLEYGAGTGLVSHALQSHVGAVTMADTSAGMREVMQQKIDAGIIRGARVWDLDLGIEGPLPEDRFDLLVAALALHHVTDVARALTNFARVLEPGGHVCIIDLDHEDGSFHGEGFEGHHGFERSELTAQLRDAGFDNVSFQTCHHVERHGENYPLFLAIATR